MRAQEMYEEPIMRFFFVLDTDGFKHIVGALDEDEAWDIASEAMEIDDLYELSGEYFQDGGMVITRGS